MNALACFSYGTRRVPAPLELACNLASRRESDLRVPERLLESTTDTTLASTWFSRPIWLYLVGLAWALAAGEWDHPATQRGVQYLMDTQRSDGTWDEPYCTGTGFPGYGVGERLKKPPKRGERRKLREIRNDSPRERPRDPAASPAGDQRRFTNLVARRIVEGAGHDLPAHRPDAVADALLELVG